MADLCFKKRITDIFALIYSNIELYGISQVNLECILKDRTLKSVVLKANDKITSTEALDQMARKVNAIAAINGTYFEAY